MHAQNSSIEYYGSGWLTIKFKRYGQPMGVAITALKNLNNFNEKRKIVVWICDDSIPPAISIFNNDVKLWRNFKLCHIKTTIVIQS